MRTSIASSLVFMLALVGCPTETTPVDAGGVDAREGVDTGPSVDAPRDAPLRMDAGSEIACTGADCAIVEIAPLGSSTCAMGG
jgi:hypothetical protein